MHTKFTPNEQIIFKNLIKDSIPLTPPPTHQSLSDWLVISAIAALLCAWILGMLYFALSAN